MTELEEAIMGKTTEKPQEEIPEQIVLPDFPTAPEKTDDAAEAQELPAAEEDIRESSDAVRRMTEELRQETEQLERSFARAAQTSPGREAPAKRAASKKRYIYVGTFSAALSLIVMGIAVTVSLFSPQGAVTAFRIAPLMLVFLGLETLLAVIVGHRARLRFSVKSIVLSVSLIAFTFILALISAGGRAAVGERGYAEERLHNILAREIRREIPSDNIRGVDIEVLLYGDDFESYETLGDLRDSDAVNLRINFASVQKGVYEFAQDCEKVIAALNKDVFPKQCFTNVTFVADDGANRYSLALNWLYQSGLSAAELAPLVGYYGNDVVSDIPDLVD